MEGYQFSKTAVEIADYKDAPYYKLLLKLPKELIVQHLQKIESEEYDDETATTYIENILAKRTEAVTKTFASTHELEELFHTSPEILKNIETTVFTDEDNFLGSGTTAKVKQLDVTMPSGTKEKFAVKYVVFPNQKTLSAAAEYAVVHEAELLTTLEALEESEHIDKDIIRVPHPYFHHTTDKIQCYGMELIDGINLQQALEEGIDEELKNSLLNSPLANRPIEEIFTEVNKFFNAIHKYCIHGDIKPRNIMVSRTGTLYIIDFGQAVLNNNVSEKAQDQLMNLREDEIKLARQTIVYLLQKLKT